MPSNPLLTFPSVGDGAIAEAAQAGAGADALATLRTAVRGCSQPCEWCDMTYESCGVRKHLPDGTTHIPLCYDCRRKRDTALDALLGGSNG